MALPGGVRSRIWARLRLCKQVTSCRYAWNTWCSFRGQWRERGQTLHGRTQTSRHPGAGQPLDFLCLCLWQMMCSGEGGGQHGRFAAENVAVALPAPWP